MLKKAMVYLGLGPDEHYDGYAESALPSQGDGLSPGHGHQGDGRRQSAAAGGRTAPSEAPFGRTVMPVPIKPGQEDAREQENDEQDIGIYPSVTRVHDAEGQISRKPHVVSPEDFQDAKEIGDCFKAGQAVIVNLQAVSRDLRRRLVDFSSGLCYGRDGKMDRVADQVYLLTPSEADYSRHRTR